jgi:hypothetical protein
MCLIPPPAAIVHALASGKVPSTRAAIRRWGMLARSPGASQVEHVLLRIQPDAMAPAQLAAVSPLARYSGRTHHLYTFQLRRWFACLGRDEPA